MPNTHSSLRTRLAVALAALAAAGAALVVSTASSPAHGSPTVLKLIGTEVGSDGADVGLPGDSIGDINTFAGNLSDPRTGGRVGRSETFCSLYEIAEPGGAPGTLRNATFHCSGIAYLHGGTLTAVGSVSFDGQGQIVTRPLAITGGTGRYAGAGGTITSKPLSGGRELVVIRLAR